MTLPLDPFLPHLAPWLLVLVRLSGIFIFAPVFGSTSIPSQVKVFFVLGLSFCVYPMLLNPNHASAEMIAHVFTKDFSYWSMPISIGAELAIGAVIGYGAGLTLMAMQLAGHMAEQQMGLGLGELYNPDLGEQSGAIATLYYMVALTIYISCGGQEAMLTTMLNTFNHVPLAGIHDPARVMDLVLGMLGSMFELAMRVSAPLLCLVFLETISMGFIARTVPQMNIMSVGFASRILISVSLMSASITAEMHVMEIDLHKAMRALDAFWFNW